MPQRDRRSLLGATAWKGEATFRGHRRRKKYHTRPMEDPAGPLTANSRPFVWIFAGRGCHTLCMAHGDDIWRRAIDASRRPFGTQGPRRHRDAEAPADPLGPEKTSSWPRTYSACSRSFLTPLASSTRPVDTTLPSTTRAGMDMMPLDDASTTSVT